jgi:hypothetical protein
MYGPGARSGYESPADWPQKPKGPAYRAAGPPTRKRPPLGISPSGGKPAAPDPSGGPIRDLPEVWRPA